VRINPKSNLSICNADESLNINCEKR